MRPLTAHEAQRDGGLAASAIAADGDGDGVVRAVHANAIRRGRRLVGGGFQDRGSRGASGSNAAQERWTIARRAFHRDAVLYLCRFVHPSPILPDAQTRFAAEQANEKEKEHRVSNTSSRVVRAVKPGRMNKGRRAGLGSRFNIGIQRACAKNIY